MQDKPQNYGEFEELTDDELRYCSRALESYSGNTSDSRTSVESQSSTGTLESVARQERDAADNRGASSGAARKSVVEALEGFLKSF